MIELLLVTTLPAMFLAARGLPDLGLVVATLVAGGLGSASANTFNCVLDRDIDEKMRRTRRRAIPRHKVSPLAGTIFGFVLAIVSTAVFLIWVNPLSAILTLAANAYYVFIYTMWLKRRQSQNIVWGRYRGLLPAPPDRVDRGHRFGGLAAADHVRDRVLLDPPAAHLRWPSATARTTRMPASRCCRW